MNAFSQKYTIASNSLGVKHITLCQSLVEMQHGPGPIERIVSFHCLMRSGWRVLIAFCIVVQYVFINHSKTDYTITPMPADAMSRVIQSAKDSPTGLHSTNQLGNTHADDPENNNRPITIGFIDAPTDSQIDHDQQIAQEDAEIEESNSLPNTDNVDPDNITIRITGVNDENCENEINKSKLGDNNNLIKDHDCGFADTAEDIKQTEVNPQDDTTRPSDH